MTMDPAITTLLTELEARWMREQAEQASISQAEAYAKVDDYLLPVGPETGRLMNDLIRAQRPAIVAEIGSSYGYSTLWLAEAARAVGGKVVSFEIHAGKIAAAQAMLACVNLDPVVRFVEGDALASLEAFDGEIGFALIDLWKDLYIPCFDRIADKLAPGAIVIADNMTFPAENIGNANAYRARIRADARFESVLLPIGAGIEVTRRLP